MFKRIVGLGAAMILAAGCASSDAADDDEEATAEANITQANPLGPEPSGKPTKYAIVLAQGNGSTPTHWPWFGVKKHLEEDGHIVEESNVPLASSEVRATFLVNAVEKAMSRCRITRKCDPTKVNIIAQSMGGLDARVLGSMPKYRDRIASLSTIATPHRGSTFADALLNTTTPGIRRLLSKFVEKWADEFQPEGAPKVDGTAIWNSLSTKHAPEFNRKYPLNPEVFNQSWAGVSYPYALRSKNELKEEEKACEGKGLAHGERPDWTDKLLVGGQMIIAGTSNEPNDGMVSVRSAKWGQFNGCLPADHQDQVGRADSDHADKRTGFNHIRFYRNVAFDLARRGF